MLDNGVIPAGSNPAGSPTMPGKPAIETAAKPGEKTAKEPNPSEARLAKLEKDFEVREARLRELEEENRYWYEQAKGGGAKNAKQAEADDDEPKGGDPKDLLDKLGARGIDELVERGLMTKKQARELIAEEARKIAREEVDAATKRMVADASLASEFPQLNDPNSEFTKRTGALYKELIADDPELKKSMALKMAARLAKAEFGAAKGGDADRLERIARQRGEYSGGGRNEDAEDEGLTDRQRTIIAKFGITEDEYTKHAKQGIRMSGRGSRRVA